MLRSWLKLFQHSNRPKKNKHSLIKDQPLLLRKLLPRSLLNTMLPKKTEPSLKLKLKPLRLLKPKRSRNSKKPRLPLGLLWAWSQLMKHTLTTPVARKPGTSKLPLKYLGPVSLQKAQEPDKISKKTLKLQRPLKQTCSITFQRQ